MKTHKLKIQDHFYRAIETGYKTFEVRKDDRDFGIGDNIEFTTIDGETREGQWKITYKLTHEDFPEGIPEGYCILGIYPIHRISDRRLFEIINRKAGPRNARPRKRPARRRPTTRGSSSMPALA